jgi:vacuolar-type H+-ATPase subunit H
MINNLIDDFNNYQYLALEKAYNNDDNLLNKMNSIINKEKRKMIDELENQEKAEADIILANF